MIALKFCRYGCVAGPEEASAQTPAWPDVGGAIDGFALRLLGRHVGAPVLSTIPDCVAIREIVGELEMSPRGPRRRRVLLSSPESGSFMEPACVVFAAMVNLCLTP